MNESRTARSYLALDDVALLEDLDNDVLLLRAAELSLKSALGSSVEGALVSVAIMSLLAMLSPSNVSCSQALDHHANGDDVCNLLVGDEDLEAVDDLGKRDAPVLLPVLDSLSVLSKDNEVVAVALVVDSDLGSVSAHVDVCLGFEWGWWCGGSVGSKFVR
jgi:hypothetical protein